MPTYEEKRKKMFGTGGASAPSTAQSYAEKRKALFGTGPAEQPEQIGMGDFRMATGEGQDNPPLPVMPDTSMHSLLKAPQATEAKNENKVYDSAPSKPGALKTVTNKVGGLYKFATGDTPEQRLEGFKRFYDTLGTTEKAFFAGGVGDVTTSVGQGLRFAGVDGGEKTQRIGEALQSIAPEKAQYEGAKSLVDPEWWKTSGVRSMAYPVAMAPIALGGAAAGGAVAGAAGLGATASAIVASIGGAAASRPIEAAMEAGQTYDEGLKRGMTEEQAKAAAKGVFWKNNALVGMDAAELFTALAPIPAPVKKMLGVIVDSPIGKVGLIGAKTVAGAAQEGAEEGVQEIFQRQAMGDPIKWDAQMKEAIGTGFAMGIPFGGVAAVREGGQANAQPQVQQAPAPTTTAEAPKVETAVQPLDRVALLREKMPGADEGKLRADVETTKNLSDEEFRSFAERYGKPIETKVEDKPAGMVATTSVEPQKDSSTLSQTTKEVIPEPAVDVEGTPILSSQVQKPLKPTIPNSELKVGDTVKVANRTPVYEVVDTKDKSMVTVREVGKPDAPTFAVGRKAVAKNENAVYDSETAQPQATEAPIVTPATQQTETPVVTPSKMIETPAVSATTMVEPQAPMTETTAAPTEKVKQVYDSAPEGYTQLRKNGNTAFTEKFAKAEAERLNAEGRSAVVIPDKNQPNLRNVYVAPKGLLADQTGAIRAPQDPTYTEDPIAQELDKSITWNARKTPLIDKLKSIPEYINNTVHYLVDNLFDSNVAVIRYQARNAGKKELSTNVDAALKLELLPKMVPGNVRAALKELETTLSPLGEKVADYFRYADAKVNLWRMERFGYKWDDGKGDLPMNPDVAKAWVDKVESGPDAQLFQDTFAREQTLFQKEGLQTLVDAGVISKEEMDKAIEDHPVYVPWYRDMEADENAAGVEKTTKEDRAPSKLGRTVVNVPNPIKKQTGSGRKLLDPMERRIRYLSRAQSVALRNKVGIALANFAQEYDKQGTGMVKVAPPMMAVSAKLQVKDQKTGAMKDTDVMRQLEELGFDPNDLADPNGALKFFRPAGMPKGYEQVVAIRQDGKVTYWRVKDKGLYEAITHMDPITQNMFAKFFEGSSSLYRTGATISPSFTIANLVRDTIDSFRLSKNQVYPGQALWKAIRMATEHDPLINRVIKDGLKQNGWVSPERLTNEMLMSIANPQEKTMSLKAAWNLYLNGRDTAEFATRLGETGLEYRRRLKNGMKDLSPEAQKVVKDFLDGKTGEIAQSDIDKHEDLRELEMNSYLRALREGGRITLNFTRDGKTTRAVNRYVPFFSIPFKAAYREYEAATEHPMTYALKTILPAVALGTAIVLLNKDDDKYFEASDFERDKYMMVPMGNGFIRIPKGNGIGGFVLNMTERAMRQWKLDDETAFRGWADTARNDLFPRISNPALELLVAGSTGYSMNMERQIIPERLKKLTETAPELQFDSRTSPTVKNVVAPALGKLPVVGKYLKSPMLTQYVVNSVMPGYSEGYFMTENYVNRGVKGVKSGASPSDIAKSVSFEELPAVGRFYSRPGEGKMGRSVDLLYEEQAKAEGAYQEVRARLADESNQPVIMDALTRTQRNLLNDVVDQLSPEEKAFYENRKDYNKEVDKLSKLNTELRALESNESMNPSAKRQRIEEIRREMTRLAANALSRIHTK